MAKKTNKGGPKLLDLTAAFAKVTEMLKDLTPEKMEQAKNAAIVANTGDIMIAFADLMINATREDIAFMSINIASVSEGARAYVELDPKLDSKFIKSITRIEKLMQKYLVYLAENLKIGKAKKKALIEQIKGNLPKS